MVKNKTTQRKIIIESRKVRELRARTIEWTKATVILSCISIILFITEIKQVSLVLAVSAIITCLFLGKNLFSFLSSKAYLNSLLLANEEK